MTTVHRDQQEQLDRLLDEGRMPHALLLYGPSGTLKLRLAQELSVKLLAHGGATDSSLERARRMSHPDVHWMYPFNTTEKEKISTPQLMDDWRVLIRDAPYATVDDWMRQIGKESKQPNIPAREILSMMEQLYMKSYEGGVKLLIIWMAEYLGQEGNRLLKLIEEPPENTFLILLAEDPEKILLTIRSRCQQLFIPALSDEEMREQLDRREVASDQQDWIIELAEGDLHEAIHIAQSDSDDIAQLWAAWLRQVLKYNSAAYGNWVTNYARMSRLDHRLFWQYGLRNCRSILRHKAFSKDAQDPVVQWMKDRLSYDQLLGLVSLCEDSLAQLERYANVSILMLSVGPRLRALIHNE